MPIVTPIPVKHETTTGTVELNKATNDSLFDSADAQSAPVQQSSGPVPGGISAPTESHALATSEQGEKGIVQLHGQHNTEAEVKDLGWNERPEKIPAPLIGGLSNEELWMLVRRFNKQMYHVKAMDHAPPGGLDLNTASEDAFSPDKLRSNVERLYMTVIVGMAAFAKHIARLRSWAETKRTATFCVIYFVAWALDMLVPLLITTLIMLIVYPPSRTFLFPPAPLALVDATTGRIKKPTAGVLGSHGSLTGAPEKHHGEAVEQEAQNFVSSFATIALSSAAGKHPENETQENNSRTEDSAPDPTAFAMKAAEAKNATSGNDTSSTHDKAKKPVEEAMWEKARPFMRTVGDVADIWERLTNALSPTSPFPKNKARLTLAGVLTPVLLLSLLIDAYTAIKGTTFFIGFGFFADPLFQRGLAWLDANIPNWSAFLDIRNTLLKGVPTNAQLTLTLLRIGEASKAPLPPPPPEHVSARPENAPKPLDQEELSLEASKSEVEDAIHPDIHTPPATGSEGEEQKPKKSTKAKKLMSFFKTTTRTSVNTALSIDPPRAKMGSKAAQNRLGVVSSKNEPPAAGPTEFPCRFHGKTGVLHIVAAAASPCVSFGYTRYVKEETPEFVIALPEIRELKKVGGLGWKSKLVVGWSLERNVIDGIQIVDADGTEWLFTAVQLRDELFNRLIAMGGQKWESW